MPTMAGMLSSIGPTLPRCGSAPSWMARSKAAAASRTRNPMAQTDGPCACAKRCAKESGSALMMKLMSPCECSVTFLLRWWATTGKPSRSNRLRNSWGSGAVYSTNSKPSVPIGLETLGSAMTGLRTKIDLVSIVTNGAPPETPSGEISPLPAVGAVQYRELGDRGRLLHELRIVDPGMARDGGPGGKPGPLGRRGHCAHRHGQGGGQSCGQRADRRGPTAPHNRAEGPAPHAPRAHPRRGSRLCARGTHGPAI